MKKVIAFLLPLFIGVSVFAQHTGKVNWVSLEEAQKLNKKEPRKILIDFYTSWCGWCKKMDATTFNNPVIADYINKNYYAVKFNAETRDSIDFKGKTFVNPAPKGKRSTHQIAAALAAQNGRIGYPTIVYLDEKLNLIQAIGSYMNAKQIDPVLKFFGEGFYKTTPYQDYLQTEYQSSFN